MIILPHNEKQWSGSGVVKSNKNDGTFPGYVGRVLVNQWGSFESEKVYTIKARYYDKLGNIIIILA